MYNIIIIENVSSNYVTHKIFPLESQDLPNLLIYKNGDHYDALAPFQFEINSSIRMTSDINNHDSISLNDINDLQNLNN